MPEIFEELIEQLLPFLSPRLQQAVTMFSVILFTAGLTLWLAVKFKLLRWFVGKDYQLKISSLKQTVGEKEAILADQSAEIERLSSENSRLAETVLGLNEKCDELQRHKEDLTDKFHLITSSDGRVWEQAGTHPLITFVGMPKRRARIVAVANMKGGVGKTTVTANLGASLARRGKRVLMLDLDHQHSLSDLCFTEPHRQQMLKSRRMIDRVFKKCGSDPAYITQCIEPVQQIANLFCVPCHENLIDIEEKLRGMWMIDETRYDVRYLLRQSLHQPEIYEDFDYILLDCPPRLTTASVNAFTAADYVMIPVKLDNVSLDAVPRMLNWVYRFRNESQIAPQLDVLGVIANETQTKEKFATLEQGMWSELSAKARDIWHHDVYLFDRGIPKSVQFRNAANGSGFAAVDPAIESVFLDLTTEFFKRVPQHASSAAHSIF